MDLRVFWQICSASPTKKAGKRTGLSRAVSQIHIRFLSRSQSRRFALIIFNPPLITLSITNPSTHSRVVNELPPNSTRTNDKCDNNVTHSRDSCHPHSRLLLLVRIRVQLETVIIIQMQCSISEKMGNQNISGFFRTCLSLKKFKRIASSSLNNDCATY